MKRVVARFADEDDASEAEAALREADVEPERPEFENPFFDPSSRPPEARGLAWGGLIGAVLGAAFVLGMAIDALWIPRLSPLLSAGRIELVAFGAGIGLAVGGFLGGVLGTLREIPAPDGPRVAATVPDARADEVAERMRRYGATAVGDAVTRHGEG